jgi:hypothetical protein
MTKNINNKKMCDPGAYFGTDDNHYEPSRNEKPILALSHYHIP